MNAETRRIFHDYSSFEGKLQELYGISNEEAHADRQIRKLRQTTSVAAYMSLFQGYAADLKWNDAALRSQFYLGLKDAVKVELSRVEATNMSALAKAAKEIDERLQELRQDKCAYYGISQGYSKAKSAETYGPTPMELDTTEKDPEWLGGRRRQNSKCYTCGALGHCARRCPRKNKVSRRAMNFLTYGEDSSQC